MDWKDGIGSGWPVGICEKAEVGSLSVQYSCNQVYQYFGYSTDCQFPADLEMRFHGCLRVLPFCVIILDVLHELDISQKLTVSRIQGAKMSR